MSGVDVEVLLLLVTELLDPISELLALGDDARDISEVSHTVQALHPDVTRGGAHPLVDAVHIVPVTHHYHGDNTVHSSPVGSGHVKAPVVVRRGEVSSTLTSLAPVPNVPEVSTPGDQELGICVTNPGEPASDQGVGHGVAPLHGEEYQDDMIMMQLPVTSLLKWIIQTP